MGFLKPQETQLEILSFDVSTLMLFPMQIGSKSSISHLHLSGNTGHMAWDLLNWEARKHETARGLWVTDMDKASRSEFSGGQGFPEIYPVPEFHVILTHVSQGSIKHLTLCDQNGKAFFSRMTYVARGCGGQEESLRSLCSEVWVPSEDSRGEELSPAQTPAPSDSWGTGESYCTIQLFWAS